MIDVGVIGSGPAALSAGIYLSRGGVETIIFEGSKPGGLLMTTTQIENYPGFFGTGPDLIENMYKQNEELGTEIIPEQVQLVKERIVEGQRIFEIYLDNKIYTARAVIIATGSQPKMLGLESEKLFWNRGVSTCAVCDGALPRFRNKGVVVVGGGDAALEEANFLSRFCDVILVHRRDEFRASEIMVKRIYENKKISIILNAKVEEILGNDDDGVTGVKVNIEGKINVFMVRGVFIAIGHRPNSGIFKNLVNLDQNGYILTKDTKTKTPGVFAAGDVIDPLWRQAIVAAGSGCIAALECLKYLK